LINKIKLFEQVKHKPLPGWVKYAQIDNNYIKKDSKFNFLLQQSSSKCHHVETIELNFYSGKFSGLSLLYITYICLIVWAGIIYIISCITI